MLFGSVYTNLPAWGAHRLSGVAEYVSQWNTYATRAIASTGTCILGRDPAAGTTNNLIPANTITFENDVWFYQDMGSLYYDQCQTTAGVYGASIITPYTIGLLGDGYWFSSTHQCNTYEYVTNSGTGMGTESLGSGIRSSSRSLIFYFLFL